MSKAKTTTEVKKDPWVPSQAEWTQLQSRGDDLTTQRYRDSQNAANATMAQAQQFNSMDPQARAAIEAQLGGSDASGPTRGLTSEINRSRNAGVDASLSNAVGGAMGATVDGGLTEAANRAMTAGTSREFDEGVRGAQNQSLDKQFDKQTRQAGNRQYAEGFQGTLSEMTDQDRRSAAFGQVKQNVANDVMSNVNATFGGSGMTGSSLHQQNLVKGLTEGIAGVENDAFQRSQANALQAAQMGQSDLGQQRQLGLAAAGSRQDAQQAQAGLALQAGGMSEQANAANRGMALQAGGMRNDAASNLRAQKLQAGGAMNQAQMAQRQAALQAAQVGQNQANTQFGQQQQIEQQRLQAASMLNQGQQQQYGNLMGMAGQQAGLGQNWQNTSQGNVMGLMGAANAGAATTQTQTEKPGFWGTMGNIATAASAIPWSDERLKKNKRQVGALFDGTPVYTYQYEDGVVPALDGMTVMGVMAQEVGHIEGAQVPDPSGFFRVNYGVI